MDPSLRWGDDCFRRRGLLEKGGYVYIMASGAHGTLYVGVTSNLSRRIWQHKCETGSEFCNENGCKTLVFYEVINDIETAIRREKAMKAWKRRWKTELISRTNPEWRDLYEDLNK
jgi:putative endonuclease